MRVAGRFELGAWAGAGGMGTVYRGVDTETGETVAVKLLDIDQPRLRERFAREAILLATVDHPGIVKYIAHGTTPDGALYLVMSWVEGETLAAVLRSTGMTIREAVAAVRRLSEALGSAHRRGVIHRDIKPENIIAKHGNPAEVVLLDFGVARGSMMQGLTHTGMVIGTPGYIAPEQARGSTADVDARCDVFALGCLLYECVTGVGPFAQRGQLAAHLRVLLVEPPSIRSVNQDVTPELAAVVERLLRKDPRERPADAGEVADLLAALPPMPETARRAKPVSQPTHPPLTVVMGSQSAPTFSFLIMINDDSQPEEQAAWEPQLRSLAAGREARFDRISDDSLVLLLSGQGAPSQGAERVALCALEVQMLLPHAAVIVTSVSVGAASDELLESSVQELVAAAISEQVSALVAGDSEPLIPLDVDTANLLLPFGQFAVSCRGDRYFLQARSAA